MRLALAAALLLSPGCILPALLASAVDCPTGRHTSSRTSLTAYTYRPDARTPTGIRVHTGGWAAPLSRIDERVAEWERCAGRAVSRCGLSILFAPTHTSACSGQPVFRCDVGGRCPGECMGTVQGSVIVLPQDAELPALPHELNHLVAGVDDHCAPIFHACAGDPEC